MKPVKFLTAFLALSAIENAAHASVSDECKSYTDCDALVACELYGQVENAINGLPADYNGAVADAATYLHACNNYPDLFKNNIDVMLSDDPAIRMAIDWSTVRARMRGGQRKNKWIAKEKSPMKIADMKVTELINAVGSDAPAPGGGAVAGLAGGIGVALTMMVNGLTLSKKGFEDDRERILDAIAKGNELKERFVDVMNRDSEVFDVLIESLALPKENDAQKAIRRGAVQASFRNCTEVPLTMMEVCLESIDLLATLVGTTNPNVVSDLGIAALTLKTAMQSAWLNVLINLSSLKDKEYADECCHKGEAMLAHAIPLAEECYEKVLKVIEKK